MGGQNGFYGQNGAHDHLSDHSSIAFMIAQQLRAVSTATICKVMKCTNKGEVKAIGRVDVLPLVDLQDGIGQTSHHVNVQNVPYLRMQGGSKAIIMDPKPGDLALVVFADRDVSAVKKNKKQSPPGSKRRFNMADGMYVGTLLADAPTSYVQFEDDGTINISPDNGTTVVKVKANDIKLFINNDLVELTPGKCLIVAGGGEMQVDGGGVHLGDRAASVPVLLVSGPATKVFGV
jgi:hypothetical protein